MRTRLLALPFLAATTLAALGGQQAAPLAVPSPCAPHEIPVRGRGLDGGTGCLDPRAPEGPADMLRARAVYDGPRASVGGAERLAALRRAQALRSAAQSLRARTGAADFATSSGAVVPGSGQAWVPLGPSPLIVDDPQYPGGQGYGNDKVQGRVAALLADPSDESGNTVYMGSANGGVWKTTDAGEKWVSIGDRLPSQSTGALAMAENGWLFVGLGEGNTGSNNYAGAGVVRTKDGGKTWSGLLPGIPEGIVTTHIAVSGQTVLVGTNWGLYRSTNLGTSFARVTLPTAGAGQESEKAFGNFVTDVRFQPRSATNALLAVGWRSGGIGAAAGLYRTTDGGATWTKEAATGFGSASASTDPIGRVTLAYDEREGHEDVVWAVVQDAGKLNNEPFPVDIAVGAEANTNNLNGVYRSGDNGATWTLQGTNQTLAAAPGSGISTTNVPLNGNYGPGVQAWYNQYVIVDPSAPETSERVIVGLEEVYQGVTPLAAGEVASPTQWQTIGRYWNACIQAVLVQLNCEDLGLPPYQGYTTHADQHAAAFAKTPAGWRLYVGNDGGVYKQDADLANGYTNDKWTSMNDGGVNTTQPYAATMGKDGTVYLGLQDNGTAKISPKGIANEVIGGDGFDVAVDPEDSDIAYEEYANGILRRTSDGGVSWSGDISPTDATGQRFSTPFELDPTDSTHFVYAGHQVWENTDAPDITAANWTQVFDVRNAETTPDAAVTAIDVHGAAAYAAWCGRPADPPAGSSSCNTTTGDGNFDPTLFHRGIATNVDPGCKRAKASTECWHQAAGQGLPNRMIQGVEIDPVDPETVYVAVASYSRHWAFDPGAMQPGVVFRSTDAGQTFHDISGNLPETFGSDVLVVGNRLLVATDVGVFGTLRNDPGEWVPFGTDIPDAVPAIEISTNPQQTKLVLATHGRGVWVLPLTNKTSGGGGGGGGDDDDKGGGKIPTTGVPAWALAAGAAPLAAALVLRRRLRGSRA